MAGSSLGQLLRTWRPRPRRFLSRYALALVLVAAATCIQKVLSPVLARPETLFFYPAIFAATWLAGLGPGLLAIALSALSIAYYFLPPPFSLAVSDRRDQADLAFFTVLALLIAVGIVSLQRAVLAREEARRAAEEAAARLDEQRALMEAVVEHAPIGLAFATPDGVLRFRNSTLRAIAGRDLAPDENLVDAAAHGALRRTDGRVVSSEEWRDLLRQAKEKVVELAAEWCVAAGASVWVSGRLAPVRNKSGRLLGVVSIVRDLSAERAIENLREEFEAVIAHDLRNPASAISLSLETELRHRVAGAGTVSVPVATLERMSRSARRLGSLVEELLDASRVELGRLSLERGDVDLGPFLTELVDDLRPSLGDHPVVVDAPRSPVVASVDKLRIGQVLSNLLDNASKYSRPASTIRLAVRPEGAGVDLSVSDQGEGIAPDLLPRLFDRFFQASRARAHKAGLGLGLYITKGIVDAHGGRLSVDSRPGEGSTFHVWLPAAAT